MYMLFISSNNQLTNTSHSHYKGEYRTREEAIKERDFLMKEYNKIAHIKTRIFIKEM